MEEEVEEEEELLWSVEDLTAVRRSGLVGTLVGCLPRAPRQNTRLGRPLLLRREERLPQPGEPQQASGEPQQASGEPQQASGEPLLASEETRGSPGCPSGTADLLRWTSICSPDEDTEELHSQTGPSDSQQGAVCASDGQQGAVCASDGQQGAVCSEEELTETQALQWEEFLSRSLEEQQQLSLSDRKSALTSSLSGRVSEAELASRLSSLDSSFQFPRSALSVQLSTCRQGLPLQPIRRELLPPEPIRSQQPSSDPTGVRFHVFRDLRRRGFYLTSGGKFGVDFLVYPGDPLRFHAHFMALCLPVGGSIPLTELLSCVRLASNVKKTLLLCSVSPPEGVLYSSLQWSHMS